MPDSFIKKFLDAPTTKEVLGWFQSGSDKNLRTLGEMQTIEESRTFAQEIYSAGAVEVFAVEIDEYLEGQNTGKLLIKLPDEASARKRVFTWAGNIVQKLGFDPEQDVGQSYLFIMLD